MTDKKKIHTFSARLPIKLWKDLKKAAKDNGRSTMSEITHRLWQSFKSE